MLWCWAMLKGKIVHHAKFGSGTVVSEAADTVSVQFRSSEQRNRGVTRTFMKTALTDDEAFPHKLNPDLK
ncbi:MAG: hypothetical protein JWM80_6284 [Cyanobacteria bacterium RYN_339]|nr:hypothetical protein [Cyanobacteria bacterium RYN_339]